MTGEASFGAYIVGVPAHDAPLLIAVREMVERADSEGRVVRERLATGFRDSYVTHYSRVAQSGSPESRPVLRKVQPW